MTEVVGSPASQCSLGECEVERYREVKVAAEWTAAVSQLTMLLLSWSHLQYTTFTVYTC